MISLGSIAADYLAPMFIVLSPFTSYTDQILSIRRDKSIGNFSLEIPLIMLVTSILKLFYWLTIRFSTTILLQAIFMILVQVVLLHVALTYRKPPLSPLTPLHDDGNSELTVLGVAIRRPYNFWNWATATPYWKFLVYYTATLIALQLLVAPLFVDPTRTDIHETPFSSLQAMIALSIEAVLPLPQFIKNAQAGNCVGLRPSLVAIWVLGDATKLWWFFLQPAGSVPLPFKLCAMFQLCCDMGLTIQFCMWGTGTGAGQVDPVALAESRDPLLLSANQDRFSPRGLPGRDEEAASRNAFDSFATSQPQLKSPPQQQRSV